ncbi:MAG: CcmD family protein [Bacteroidota bacterium]
MHYINKLKTVLTIICVFLLSIYSFAQKNMDIKTEEPTDFMHSNGKIFVVMAVVVTIVTGLLIYLINLDRKIGKVEKKLPEQKR